MVDVDTKKILAIRVTDDRNRGLADAHSAA